MKRRWIKIAMNWLTFSALVGYVGFTVFLIYVKGEVRVLNNITITVIDSTTSKSFINQDSVIRFALLGDEVGRKLRQIDKYTIEDRLLTSQFIDSAVVFTSIDGSLNIAVRQRAPMVRFQSSVGEDFFIDSKLHIFNANGLNIESIPLITSDRPLTMSRSAGGRLSEIHPNIEINNLKKVINFALYINSDSLLSRLVEQFWPSPTLNIELIARNGYDRILVGSADRWESQVAKIRDFYLQAGGQIQGEHSPRVVDVSYERQIIIR